jgi:hypothetical protein
MCQALSSCEKQCRSVVFPIGRLPWRALPEHVGQRLERQTVWEHSTHWVPQHLHACMLAGLFRLFPFHVHPGIVAPWHLSGDFYELCFGGFRNTKSVIRRGKSKPHCVKATAEGQRMSQDEFQAICVSVDISSGRVAAGTGVDIQKPSIMEFTDSADSAVITPFCVGSNCGSSCGSSCGSNCGTAAAAQT